MKHIILSDIHANFVALQAISGLFKSNEKVKYWCLGDIIGYGPQPVESVSWTLKNCPGRWIAGNHDAWLIEEVQNKYPYNGNAVTLLKSHKWILQHKKQLYATFLAQIEKQLQRERTLTKGDTHWFQGLMKYRTQHIQAFFTHGAAFPAERRLVDYMFPWSRERLTAHLHALARYRESVSISSVLLFVGHTHYPYLVTLNRDNELRYASIPYGEPISVEDGVWVIGCGASGQPRDGDPRASFVILNPRSRSITFRRVAYDVAQVEAAFRDDPSHLPFGVWKKMVERLRVGDRNAENAVRFERVYRQTEWGLEANMNS